MNVVMLGTGYVGLVSGSCYAELGHTVTCVDIDQEKIAKLKEGHSPIYEPGLESLVAKNVAAGRLSFSTEVSTALSDADLVMICVGTPPKPDGQANMQYVYQAAEDIGKYLNKYIVVVDKSTVPVGTGRKVARLIKKHYTGEFDVVSCPEFLREGSAIKDFMNPDRIVIGTDAKKAKHAMLELHERLDCPKIITKIETAEMIKYAANAFLACKISFINEIANVCENVGADVTEVARGIGHDKRIGRSFLNAGIGYGGSCFPKDVRALHYLAGMDGYSFQLLRSIIEVNNHQRWKFFRKIKSALGGFEGKTIGVWGLSFKPNTDDIRESIALDLMPRFIEEGATIQAFDPEAMEETEHVLPEVSYKKDALAAAVNVDCLIIFTEWPAFKEINLPLLKEAMKTPEIFDGRNLFVPEDMKQLGFIYHSVGR